MFEAITVFYIIVAALEGIWIICILKDLDLKNEVEAFIIFEDNQGCIEMAQNFESKQS